MRDEPTVRDRHSEIYSPVEGGLSENVITHILPIISTAALIIIKIKKCENDALYACFREDKPFSREEIQSYIPRKSLVKRENNTKQQQ